jgi:DNA recombination protein RmuC
VTLAIVILLGLVLALLLVLVLRPAADAAATQLLQQQLVEVRGRLEALAASQQELPRALADGRAAQAEAVADQLRTLGDLRDRLSQLVEATRRVEAVGASVAEVQALLKVPKLRGTLGEIWLEELLRQVFPSGLYQMQYGFRSGERVDAVIRVADHLVPVDAKFPLEACQRMLAAEGEDAVRERREFRRSLKARVDEIAAKYIRPDEGTFEFALMYVPAEAVYYEAVIRGEDPQGEGSVVGYALARKVIPVSPNTLYAYLAAIIHGLRGLAVAAQAKEILEALGGLAQEFAKFQRAFEVVGRHLTNARGQYEEAERVRARIAEAFERLRGAGGTTPAPEAAAELS